MEPRFDSLREEPLLFLREWAAFFTLAGFAIAQPIYSLLGQNVEFFVAHKVERWTLLAFVFVLSFGIATTLAFIVAIAGKVSNRLRAPTMALAVGVLIGVFVLPFVVRFGSVSSFVVFGFAVVAAIAAMVFTRSIVSFATFAAPIALLFPIIFLFFTPAKNILFPAEHIGMGAQNVRNPAPIVFIVFDEFNSAVLLNEKGEIDNTRYPNFSSLASDALWFPNATSVHNQTLRVMPAILTGKHPSSIDQLPNLTSHPQNLFTLLEGTYSVNAFEPLTSLCPKSVCPDRGDRLPFSVLLSDTAIVYFHTLFPAIMAREFLPPIDTGWGEFGKETKKNRVEKTNERTEAQDAVAAHRKKFRQRFAVASSAGRAQTFGRFIESIDATNGVLNFLHILLPHQRWEYLPNGRKYIASAERLEMDDKGQWFNQQSSEVAFNRYMLQVGFVDTMIGQLIQKLKTEKRYNDTMIIVTADHVCHSFPVTNIGKYRAETRLRSFGSLCSLSYRGRPKAVKAAKMLRCWTLYQQLPMSSKLNCLGILMVCRC